MKLSNKSRNNLPKSVFAFPGKRSFPLNDSAHARNALARAHFLSPTEQSLLRRKVHKKFPGIGKAHAMAQALKGAQ
jgi:hypothetical protein